MIVVPSIRLGEQRLLAGKVTVELVEPGVRRPQVKRPAHVHHVLRRLVALTPVGRAISP